MKTLRRWQKSYPVFLIEDKNEFLRTFNISRPDFVPDSIFPSEVIEILDEPGTVEKIDYFAETGFFTVRDKKTEIPLKFYFNRAPEVKRAFVILNKNGEQEISALGESTQTPLISSLVNSLNNYRKKRRFKLFEKTYGSSEKPLIMAIVNVTPDSFYSKSRTPEVENAVKKAVSFEKEGADIIDIGGLSTRPGSEAVSIEEEKKRVISVIKEVSKAVNIPVSVDTYRPEVAEKALGAGAKIVNDIYGFRQPGMLEFLAKEKVTAIMMHMQGKSPKSMQKEPFYEDVVGEISCFFNYQIGKFVEYGGDITKLIIDPGIGFGKRYQDNLDILINLKSFFSFGLPVLIGHSRKSFIGIATGDLPPGERLSGSIAAGSLALLNGADIIRVHDVKQTKRYADFIGEVVKRKYGKN